MITKYDELKFVKKQLAHFDEVEKKALEEASVLESLRYILSEIYRFGVYVFNRIEKENIKVILISGDNDVAEMSSHGMLRRLEEIINLLTEEELKYLKGLRWVYEHQLAILKLYTSSENVGQLRKPTQLLNQRSDNGYTQRNKIEDDIKKEKAKYSPETNRLTAEGNKEEIGYMGVELPGRSIPYRIKPFFDDRIIFQQLNDLDVKDRLPYIKAVLQAIEKYFKTKDIYSLPLHIRLLRRQLEGQELIYENLSKPEVTVTKAPLIDASKRSWSGTKTEFARLIVEVYDKEKGKYKSLKNATEKIFNEYLFEDQNWTKEKCYDLVRKN